MLRNLEIRDILIIDRLDLAFQPGLNVLTGETGAGKSILLDALGFVLGWRGRAELARKGAEQGEVTAIFDLPEGHAARAVLREAGLPGGSELILRRVNTSEGRKSAWVNDRRASGEVLRSLSDSLVELHGQQDDRGLLNARGHRALLDEFAGARELLEQAGSAWRALGAARKALGDATEAIEAARKEEDFLRHAVEELDALSPEPGEEEALDARRRLMQASERIRGDVSKAHAAMGQDGAEGQLGNALRWLQDAAEQAEGRLDGPIAALSRALAELGEAEQGVARAFEALNCDPADLEAAEERLFAIRRLARKHEVAPDELGGFAEKQRAKLAALESGAADLKALAEKAEAAEADYAAAAAALRARRREAAAELDRAMAEELPPLKLERAAFAVEVGAGEPGPSGEDSVAFTVATNPGAPPGPLSKIASGGELSRFLLALKACLARSAGGVTMIFDEIDRGVGGATADAVGRRLRDLAEGAQVLVVTHSPQVAARGQHHWQVSKHVDNDQALSSVMPLAGSDRIDEIARMLAGDKVTDEARGAAKALLAG